MGGRGGTRSDARVHPQPWASARSRQTENRACDHEALDLARALVDLGDLGVAVVALDRELLRVAVAAEDLDRLARLPPAPSPTRTASPSRPPRCAARRAASARRLDRRAGAPHRSRSPCRRASTGSPGSPRSAFRTARRSSAYARRASYAACAIPTACAAMPIRPAVERRHRDAEALALLVQEPVALDDRALDDDVVRRSTS